MHALDAGCGTGGFLPLLAERVGAAGRLSAVDMAEEHVAAVSASLRAAPLPCPADVRTGDVTALPFPAHSFDALWSANVTQYLSNAQLAAMLAEARRVVRPGGLVAVKESEITALQSQPAPPTLLWRLIAAVAQACECDPRGTKYLLDFLTSLNILLRHDDLYSLTPTAAAFLVPGRKSYAGDLVLAFTGPDIWDSVRTALRSGKPAPFEEFHAQDAWLESYSRTRISQSRAMWAAAGIRAEEHERLELLDIACGCAIKSLALALDAPSIHVTCLDTPLVLQSAADLAERLRLTPQVTLWPDDLTSADFGVSRFHACLLGQITHYLSPQHNLDLLRRVHAALTPGGTLVIDVTRGSAEPDEWAGILSVLLWANSGGGAHSLQDYTTWLAQAGFAPARALNERWLAAVR